MCKGVATQGLIWESYEAISGPLVPPSRAWPPTCQGRKGHPGGKLPPYSCPLLDAKHLKLSTLVTWSFLLCSCLSVCLSDYYSKMLLLTHIVWSQWHICELYMKRNIYSVKKKCLHCTWYVWSPDPSESWRYSGVKTDRVFHEVYILVGRRHENKENVYWKWTR